MKKSVFILILGLSSLLSGKEIESHTSRFNILNKNIVKVLNNDVIKTIFWLGASLQLRSISYNAIIKNTHNLQENDLWNPYNYLPPLAILVTCAEKISLEKIPLDINKNPIHQDIYQTIFYFFCAAIEKDQLKRKANHNKMFINILKIPVSFSANILVEAVRKTINPH